MSLVSRRAVTLLAALCASALILGCGSGTNDEGAATPAKTGGAGASPQAKGSDTVAVDLAEWTVKPAASGRAGQIKFNVKNAGSIPHELVVLKTDAEAGSLTKDANARVDESKYPPVGRTKEIANGGSEALEASLTAGKYVLICNIAGHYDLGMRTGFTVN